MLFNPLLSPKLGGFLKGIGDTPKPPVLPRKDTSFYGHSPHYNSNLSLSFPIREGQSRRWVLNPPYIICSYPLPPKGRGLV
jgi:hypothetical protein